MTTSNQANILLVGDRSADLLLLASVVETLGENLVPARSDEEALEKVSGTDFAAILMDVRMPTLDSLQTARRIRSQPKSGLTPIIFLAAPDDAGAFIDEAYALGAVDLLTRPLRPAILQSKLEFFIELFRSKNELRAERAFLQAVLEAVEDGVVACNAQGVLTLFNRATREFHGLPEAPLPADRWADHYRLFRPDAKTPMPTEEIPLFRALAGERVRGAEMVIAPRDGPPRTLVASGEPLFDELGRKLGAVVSMHDLTARHEAQAARQASSKLREVNERLAATFKQAPAFMCVLRGPEHRFEMANDRYIALIGGRDVVGRTVREALPEVAEQGFLTRLDEVYRTGETFVGNNLPLRLQRQAGQALEERFMDFVFLPLRHTDGSVSGILVHGVDLTARHRAEEALRESEERYRTLFESMDEGFCLIEMLFDDEGRPADYRFLEANRAFEKHTGLVDVMGRTIRELVPNHEAHWFDIYGKVALTGEPVRFVNEAQGLGRWYDVYATRLGGPGGRKLAVLFNDITLKKRAEDELRRLATELADSDRRKNEFLATLAHELRNPLAPLRNALQVMRLTPDDPTAVVKARDMMERQLGQMVHLVDDLLDVARISSGKLELKKERVELNRIVASSLETSLPLIEAGRHELNVDLPAELLWVDADATRLSQVLSNLLNNAARYTPSGGRIRLAASREADGVRVTVTDNGIGIPAEALSHVFEMFTQLDREAGGAQGGLGIGLSLVRRLVELHDGTVTVASPGLGQGCSFAVCLPLAACGPSEPPPDAGLERGPNPPAMRTFRVLVVDDNADAAHSLSALLQIGGHATRVAHDGHKALRMARDFQPEVIFLDIGMPGMNGYEVAKTLRRTPGMERIVLVALTGWGAEDDHARSRSAGFDAHLTKPAAPEAIEDLLSELGAGRDGAAATS